MPDSNEPLYTTQAKHRVMRPPSNQDAASLLSNFQRERAQYPSFSRRQVAKVAQESTAPLAVATAPVEKKPATRRNIAFFSPAGGSGKSTMVAALGSILCQQGKRVLLFDASPWQSIAFHFGASEAKTGHRIFFAPGSKETSLSVFSCGDGDQLLSGLDEITTSTPFDYVLSDLSGTSGDSLLALLRKCEIVFIPLLPDFSALRNVETVKKLLEPLGRAAPRMHFVLNCMDDSGTAREVLEILNESLGDQLFPSFILHQPEVRKAFAEGIVLPSFAPQAQATAVFEEIAQWLLRAESAAVSMARRWSEG